jgi:7 transmembrane sweet-taste receptor of 3 GCPR/Bacterial extracellular solute-binding proteins, family 3
MTMPLTMLSLRRGISLLLLLIVCHRAQSQGVTTEAPSVEPAHTVSIEVEPASSGSEAVDLFPPRIGGLIHGNNSSNSGSLQDFFWSRPSITLRAAVITRAIPLAWREGEDEGDDTTSNPNRPLVLKGFLVDLLHRLEQFALEDNVTLKFDLEEAPPYSYDSGANRMANDCNTTDNPVPWEDCYTHDLWVGDIYSFPERLTRTLFTPPLIETAAASIRYLNRHSKLRVFNTIQEADASREPICVLDGSQYDKEVVNRYPNAVLVRCTTHEECIYLLKQDACCLFVEDELQLGYLSKKDKDFSLQLTPQRWKIFRIAWPLSATLDPRISTLLIRWVYAAQVNGTLDDLYDEYFTVSFCPLGWAGPNCTSPCSSTHGLSARDGTCVCESTKWTGEDCFTEVPEDLNLIPRSLLIVGNCLMALNFVICLLCATWLYHYRKTAQVQMGQPIFLCLVLLGCFVSTSVIVVLGQQDGEMNQEDGQVPYVYQNTTSFSTSQGELEEGLDGNDYVFATNAPVYSNPPRIACMAIPWLYSVGFCITFGTLFAKIRRVYLIFRAAAAMRRLRVSVRETVSVVAGVLLVDVLILTVWTVVDPLQWERTTLTADKYGVSLTSQGHCTSKHWGTFAMTIGIFHFALLCIACIMCYVSRAIPTRFSEANSVSVAMVSNFQIFVVGIPLLIILGTDSVSSYFVRVVIVWMNDLAVVALIFGNLIYSVHFLNAGEARSSRTLIGTAIREFNENSKKNSRVTVGRQDSDMPTNYSGSYRNADPDNVEATNRAIGSRDGVDRDRGEVHALPAIQAPMVRRSRVSFKTCPLQEGAQDFVGSKSSSGESSSSDNDINDLLPLDRSCNDVLPLDTCTTEQHSSSQLILSSASCTGAMEEDETEVSV